MKLSLVPIALFAASLSAAPVDFVRDVRPIFQKHCYECHGEQKQKSGLRLDVKSAALKGGDKHGPNVVAGSAATSSLIQFITSADDNAMPPKGERLSVVEIATLTAWINEGAVWPEGVDAVKLKDKADHWSFKPLATTFEHTSIDGFINAKLKANGLAMSPEADRVTWLRRVSFDLIGLPPTQEQVAAFATDRRSDAHEHVVDDLLNSPRYGERWAQHWLDVVRYADTHGFEVNTERPNAWPYRDYVIDAFNADTPYDQFIREQIVGDALGKDAATGFLVTASVLLPGQIGKDEPSKRLARQDSLDEIVMNIGQTFLGLSIGCARCHDHKFDPISAKDYYSMQAFVAGVEYQDRELDTPAALAARQEAKQLKARLAQLDKELARFAPLAKSGAERPAINARENVDRFAAVKAQRMRFTINATNNLEPCIDELEVFNTTGENVALATCGTTVESSGNIVVADRHDLKHLNDGRYGNSRSWMSNEKGKGWVILKLVEEQFIERIVWGRDREGKFKDRLATDYLIEVADKSGTWQRVADSTDRAEFGTKEKKSPSLSIKGLGKADAKLAATLIKEKAGLEQKLSAVDSSQKVFAGTFRTPDEIRVLSRGDPEQPKEEVTPTVLTSFGKLQLPKETAEQKRRQVLADWIASPANPLTTRVMVNRIWQGHFGTGLVETPSDFGNNGMKPSHPELLDWLAQEFMRGGWSMKHLHRLIVLSTTYRQSSIKKGARSKESGGQTPLAIPSSSMLHAPNPMLVDADNHLLWHYPSRRLEAEAIRDSMLAVSGQLDLKMHGRGFDLFNLRGGLSGFKPVESFKGEGLRRMIYAHKVRREREAIFGAFDCPDAGQSSARRRESTTPIQALNLFNSVFTLERASALAARAQREAGDDLAKQIQRCYQLTLGREALANELHDVLPVLRKEGLAVLCRALMNSNEFLFVP